MAEKLNLERPNQSKSAMRLTQVNLKAKRRFNVSNSTSFFKESSGTRRDKRIDKTILSAADDQI